MADAGKIAYFFERWLKYSVKYQRKRFGGDVCECSWAVGDSLPIISSAS